MEDRRDIEAARVKRQLGQTAAERYAPQKRRPDVEKKMETMRETQKRLGCADCRYANRQAVRKARPCCTCSHFRANDVAGRCRQRRPAAKA